MVYNDKFESVMKQAIRYVSIIAWLRSFAHFDRVSLIFVEDQDRISSAETDGMNPINYQHLLRVAFDSIRHVVGEPHLAVVAVHYESGNLPEDIGRVPKPRVWRRDEEEVVVFKQTAGKPFETVNEALSMNRCFANEPLSIGRDARTGLYTFYVVGTDEKETIVVEQPYHPLFMSLKDNTIGGRIVNSWLLKSAFLPCTFSGGSGLWRKPGGTSLLGIHDSNNGYMDVGYTGKSKRDCREYTVVMKRPGNE